MNFVWIILSPLKSRKIRTALATIIAAYIAQAGLKVSPEIVNTILGVGLAVIAGTAIEDHGRNVAGNQPTKK